MKWAALALVVVALALAALWGRGGGERGAARETSSDARVVAQQAPPAELVAPGEADETSSAPPAPSPAPRTEIPVEAPAPRIASDELALSGTFVVVDEHGREHAGEDGHFRMLAGTSVDVDVRAGRWTSAIPRATKGLMLEWVVLGERAAALEQDGDGRLAIPADGFLALRARWAPECVLSLRDRETDRELAPVLLVDDGGGLGGPYGHPGRVGVRAQDLGPSPAFVPTGRVLESDRVVHVRSPGYAWSRVVLDEERGGALVVALDRAGDLEVRLTGAEPDPAAVLRVLRDDDGLGNDAALGNGDELAGEHLPLFERALAGGDGLVSIDALPVGRCRVLAAIGEHWDVALVLAEAEAEIVAGTRTTVVLALEEVTARRVPLAGTLFVPPEWELAKVRISFELVGAPIGGIEAAFTLSHGQLQPAEPRGTYRLSGRHVQPGLYRVALRDLSFEGVLEVPPEGTFDAHVEVPPPCTVAVRCVDETSGAAAAVVDVRWSAALPGGARAELGDAASWNPETERFGFRAPATRLRVVAYGRGVETASVELDALPGHNEVVVRTRRATGVRLVLRDGATEVKWDAEWTVEVHPMDGQRPEDGWCYSGELRHREPGRYRVSFGEMQGYERVPDLEVRLVAGEVGEHVIELRRAR